MKIQWLWLCAVVALSIGCVAQSVTSLGGRVTDPSGAVVAGAEVRLTSSTNGALRTTKTSGSGEYQFNQLMPGTYNLTVAAPGFSTVAMNNIELRVSTPATVDLSLPVAASRQAVQVISSEQPLINTTDATLGNDFDSLQISTLPIEGRNVVELLSLQPGVTFIGKNAGNDDSDSRAGAVNGARSDQSNVTLWVMRRTVSKA